MRTYRNLSMILAALAPQRLFSVTLLLVFGLVIGATSIVLGGDARAQCTGAGVAVGACPAGMGFAGCCEASSSVQWCESDVLCEIDCTANVQTQNSCCQEGASAGCCDASITQCVCNIDSYCCDDFFGWDIFCVDIAVNSCGGCGSCDAPATWCGWLDDQGFYDCRPAPSADPSGLSPQWCADLDSSCTPSCGGKQCGQDGCGGLCGSCGAGETCGASGQCTGQCAPDCFGKTCGADGCGGLCGSCGAGQQCVSGECQGSCTPDCLGKTCGDDGCGGTCGSCGSGLVCASGTCACAPSCAGKSCGPDGCGGLCGSCAAGESCGADGQCGEVECTCAGKECGDDGCGTVCGFCGLGTVCEDATQICVANTPPPVAEPTSDTADGPREGEQCPAGQVWNPYAGSCVVGSGPGADAANDEGCGGGAAPTWPAALVFGLLALAPRRRRRQTH